MSNTNDNGTGAPGDKPAPAKTVALTPPPQDQRTLPLPAPAEPQAAAKPTPAATVVLTGPAGASPEPGSAAAAMAASTGPSATPAAITKHGGGDSTAPRAAGDDPLIGHVLGGYVIVRKLAEGGMGVVYEGQHEKIGRRGAIKVLRLEYCQNEEVVQRFYQEARSVNEIRHENIVDVYDFGRDDAGRVFLVMEFLEGEPLAARIARGGLTWAEILPILEQTIRALKAAHDKGFVHRDLKPDNIWLRKRTDGGPPEVKVLDFGIAKLVGMEGAKDKLTRTGSIIGTPHYMSPEQINGAATIDQRSDIYSLGVIVYELFAGVTPFPGDNLAQIITGHLFQPVPRLNTVPDSVGMPAQVADVVDGMLVKEPTGRYQKIADVLGDLKAIQQNKKPTLIGIQLDKPKAPGAGPDAGAGAGDKAPAKGGKAGLKIAAAGLVLAAAAAGAYVFISRGKKSGGDKPGPSVAASPSPSTGQPGTPGQPDKPDKAEPPPIDYDKVRADSQVLLRSGLKEAEPGVRTQAADALSQVKDQPSVPTLTELMEKDPDAEVRAHAASALGALGANDLLKRMAELEKSAAPALKVWLADAQARMGDAKAKKRLDGYAGSKDLSIAYKAALALADVSAAGDKKTIARLTALAAREAELNDLAPYAGAVLLTRLARLQHAKAREVLYGILESNDEGARLAGAEGLARLGDQAAQKPLAEVLAATDSPNRLVAAVALAQLGDYTGFDLINERLADKDPATRRLAARGLGDIGERDSVRVLLERLGDDSWPVRIAAGVGLLQIVGLDPMVLAQASVDWAKSALASEDWAVRNAGAGLIGDVPEKKAVPLLAAAIADPDPRVRRSAVRSARKLRSPEAVQALVEVASSNTDMETKEETVKSLGEMDSQLATPVLTTLAADEHRIGIFASGALIALGHPENSPRLESAVGDRKKDMRMAAVEAAVRADDPVVLPTLLKGSDDKEVEIRLLAAEGLVARKAEAERATAVFTPLLANKNIGIAARAQAGLLRLGQPAPGGSAPTAVDMLGSPDAKTRIAAVTLIAAMESKTAVPLLRRTLVDTDGEVRRAGLEATDALVAKDKQDVVRLTKLALKDSDPAQRARASARLAKLVEPLKAPTGAATPAAQKADLGPLEDKVKAAESELATFQMSREDLGKLRTGIDKDIAKPAEDDAELKAVEKQLAEHERMLAELGQLAAHLETTATEAQSVLPAPLPDEAQPLLARASAAAATAKKALEEATSEGERTHKKAREWLKAETSDDTTYLAAAEAELAAGKLGAAKRSLDRAAKTLDKGQKMPALEIAYATLYDKMASQEDDPAAKLKLLKQAKSRYDSFAKVGAGSRVARAKERSEELADEIKELEVAAPAP